jgi:glycosyltransferase involved in cell wall biosynthesis
VLDKLLPKDSKRRKFAKKLAGGIGVVPPVKTYTELVAEQKDKIPLYPRQKHTRQPVISIVVPAFNTPKSYILPLVYSVASQTYQNWELVLVDASTDRKAKNLINKCADIDKRIKIFETENKGISANTNYGIDKSSGEYIGFVDHDDTIEPDALDEIVKAINKNPEAGLIYTDEDKLSEDGKKYRNPHYKPDWSPDLLTHVNYITHLSVIKRTLIEKVGKLDTKKDGAQDYDLILKIADTGAKIVHIPKILYHWREAKNSTAADIQNKNYIFKAGEAALADHYRRLGLKAKPKAIKNKPGFYKTVFDTKNPITVIFTPFSNKSLVAKYIQILTKGGFLNDIDLILPEELKDVIDVKVNFIDGQDIYLQNALKQASEHVIIVNDFVFPTSKDCFTEISGVLEQGHIHAAAPIIIRPDNYVEDSGIVINKKEKYRLFKGYRFGVNTYFGDTDWTRDVDELSGNVIAIRKKDLQEFIKDKKITKPGITLHNYSKTAGGRFNVVLSTAPVVHARTEQPNGGSQFMNPALTVEGSDIRTYPNDKQMLDALEVMERNYG